MASAITSHPLLVEPVNHDAIEAAESPDFVGCQLREARNIGGRFHARQREPDMNIEFTGSSENAPSRSSAPNQHAVLR